MHPDDFDRSWARIGPRLRALLTVAQARAAVDGANYLPLILAAQGIPDEPEGEVDPSKLAGVASSGADLSVLLYTPVIRAKQNVATGMAAAQALTAARGVLDGIMLTQVADAGRVSTGTAMVSRPNLHGYVRMLTRPSCARCVVQAGKTFKWNTGFLRHPRCDCVHIPTTEDTFDSLSTDPLGYFQALPAGEQEKTFGKAGAQAIRDGADLGQVVNARSGMQTASVFGKKTLITDSGTTKRGLAGQRLAAAGEKFGPSGRSKYQRVQVPRLMPEQIYKDASSRADAIRLLRRFGYVT